MSQLTLAQRVTAVHESLAAVPHAFGGALALAYYAEPRATIDIDLNVFVPAASLTTVLSPLGLLGARVDDPAIAGSITRDGQVRVFWDATPIDLFFAYDAFHDAAAMARRDVPFADGAIPVLAVEHLLVCKAIFDRRKDWVDIEEVIEAGTVIDVAEVLRWVARIAGDEDPRFARVAAILTRR